MRSIPDVLVLGGGGRQGDAWMSGVLAGLEDSHEVSFADCEYMLGTSAGSIVAAKLASGRRLKRPDPEAEADRAADDSAEPERECEPLPEALFASALRLVEPFTGAGLLLATLPGELARSAALAMVPTSAVETLDFAAAFPPEKVSFDGRLRMAAVERSRGRRVIFGAPDAPPATVAQALRASCALPLVFGPTLIDGHEYFDGALWSPTNADAAPASRGSEVLILAPMASHHGPFLKAVRVASRALLLVEAAALRGHGAKVELITPDRASAQAIGADLMAADGLDATLAAGYRQGLHLAA
ncbi:patatin-like phospholipase family protein [Conexibacter sp. S30A1]|uniref:patatin-like phospholipase family protein n=1 Tax=Conexibacter sp. S30A1 TaxID=2937800 RepID=UPI00200F4E0D|nr:patatin-like phospholipase family protein [Conexibacter sp. S30A1]